MCGGEYPGGSGDSVRRRGQRGLVDSVCGGGDSGGSRTLCVVVGTAGGRGLCVWWCGPKTQELRVEMPGFCVYIAATQDFQIDRTFRRFLHMCTQIYFCKSKFENWL